MCVLLGGCNVPPPGMRTEGVLSFLSKALRTQTGQAPLLQADAVPSGALDLQPGEQSRCEETAHDLVSSGSHSLQDCAQWKFPSKTLWLKAVVWSPTSCPSVAAFCTSQPPRTLF